MRFAHMILVTSGLALLTPIPAAAKSGHCPPGLAKKAVPCVPPGQAKKYGDYRYKRGDYLNDYVLIDRPYRYGLNRGDTYVRVGNYVYRINRETREVLDLIGAVNAILN